MALKEALLTSLLLGCMLRRVKFEESFVLEYTKCMALSFILGFFVNDAGLRARRHCTDTNFSNQD